MKWAKVSKLSAYGRAESHLVQPSALGAIGKASPVAVFAEWNQLKIALLLTCSDSLRRCVGHLPGSLRDRQIPVAREIVNSEPFIWQA